MSWLDWKQHNLETQFNPRAALGTKTDGFLASWENKSQDARDKLLGRFDIAYGDHPLMQFDYHPYLSNAPVIINIHGGFWRSLDKSLMRHHMVLLSCSGFSTVNVNYPLCPEISLTQIVQFLELALEKIINFVDKVINDAELTGSVNTVFLNYNNTVIGENTDVYGLQAAYLKEIDYNLNKKSILDKGFGLADIMLISCLDWAIYYEFKLPENIMSYRENIKKDGDQWTEVQKNYVICEKCGEKIEI